MANTHIMHKCVRHVRNLGFEVSDTCRVFRIIRIMGRLHRRTPTRARIMYCECYGFTIASFVMLVLISFNVFMSARNSRLYNI